ncbi:hypothetical protein HYC85_022355 [Camellia sinensis]|uniref:Protein N-terminal glutamine amidohydrolase n=1 Tax=Camellia sinensis TaxID=4442 RepID=A0A7J7GP75_CAMSI|nr:hypothetical protein HYC85_022355 [Camellia sinensis]
MQEGRLDLYQANNPGVSFEENVYLLCKKLCTSGVVDAEGSELFVVFISNEKKQGRKASPPPNHPYSHDDQHSTVLEAMLVPPLPEQRSSAQTFSSNHHHERQGCAELMTTLQVPLWHQKASQRADGVILWDYHAICILVTVVLRKKGDSSPLVWDLDSVFHSHLLWPPMSRKLYDHLFSYFLSFRGNI